MSVLRVVAEAAVALGEFVGRAKPAAANNDVLKAIQAALRADHCTIPVVAGLAGVNAFGVDRFATMISQPPSLTDLQAVTRVLFPHLRLSDGYKFVKAVDTENVNAPPRKSSPVNPVYLSSKNENEMHYLKEKLGLRAYDSTARWDSAPVWDGASLTAESTKINRETERMVFRDVAGGMVSTTSCCQYWKLICLCIDQSAGAERRAETMKRTLQVAGDLDAATRTGMNLVRHAVVMHGTRPGVAFARDNTLRIATLLAQDAAVAATFPNYREVDDGQFRLCTMTAAHLRAAFETIAKAVEGKLELVISPKEAALVLMARVYLYETDVVVPIQVA